MLSYAISRARITRSTDIFFKTVSAEWPPPRTQSRFTHTELTMNAKTPIRSSTAPHGGHDDYSA